MESIVIKEDRISRRWLSSTILKASLNLFQKWWLLCIVAIFLVAIFLILFGIQEKAWPLLIMVPTFPLLIALVCILIHPIYEMPQTWILDDRKIKARGFRLIGSVLYRNVYEWRIENMEGLTNYYRLHFKWKKWKGVACGQHSILVPASVPIEKVEDFFSKQCNR
jgi:hypothetical protein